MILLLVSLLLSRLPYTDPSIHACKCASLAFGIMLLSVELLSLHKHTYSFSILRYLSIIIMSAYGIVLIDTYWIHALTWFPGILRYALFSTYGVWYILFIIPGVLWYYGTSNQKK